jgi:hypothetical protein
LIHTAQEPSDIPVDKSRRTTIGILVVAVRLLLLLQLVLLFVTFGNCGDDLDKAALGLVVMVVRFLRYLICNN